MTVSKKFHRFSTLKSLALFVAVFSLTSSCKHRASGSGAKVIGGIENYDIHPSVIGLYMAVGDQINSVCTGTVVRHDLVVTAAHCLKGKKFDHVFAFDKASDTDDPSKVLPTSIGTVIFPDYDPDEKGLIMNKDVAFVVFRPHALDKYPVASFASKEAVEGQEVSVVGYGHIVYDDRSSNPDQKRYAGRNRIMNVYTEYGSVIVLATTTIANGEAGLGSGDSGGPLLNNKDEILGIAQSNSLKLPDTPLKSNNDVITGDNPLKSAYTNIFNPGIAAFIAAVMKDPAPTQSAVQHIRATPIKASNGQTEPRCDRNQYCKDGWGWLHEGEDGCSSSTSGWIADKTGCSCRCSGN